MLPVIFLPSAIAAVAELIGTVVVTTLAARAASDLYDSVTSRAGTSGPKPYNSKEAA